MISSPCCVLSIAGSDCSGGAGIQADIKAISATGGYGAAAITALTAQNTQKVEAIQAVSSELVGQQLDAVFSDIHITAVKIGMLYNREIIATVARAIEQFKPSFVVLDPVMVAKGGAHLIQPVVIDYLKTRLFHLATVITPNIFEAEKIIDSKIDCHDKAASAAKIIAKQYQTNIVVTGGHLGDKRCMDAFYHYQTQSLQWFSLPKISTKNTHGTGCTFSAAIASYLAQGYLLAQAIGLAKRYVNQAIISAKHLRLGMGCGPVDHFYHLKSTDL